MSGQAVRIVFVREKNIYIPARGNLLERGGQANLETLFDFAKLSVCSIKIFARHTCQPVELFDLRAAQRPSSSRLILELCRTSTGNCGCVISRSTDGESCWDASPSSSF